MMPSGFNWGQKKLSNEGLTAMLLSWVVGKWFFDGKISEGMGECEVAFTRGSEMFSYGGSLKAVRIRGVFIFLNFFFSFIC